MITVTMYRLNRQTRDAEEIGAFVLEPGQPMLMKFPGDPDHHPPGEEAASPRVVLEQIQVRSVFPDQDSDEEVTAAGDPERWLRALPTTYKSPYFWAELKETP